MGRARTLRTLVDRIGDRQLISFWQLRSTLSNKADHKLVRNAIVGRLKEMRIKRLFVVAEYNGPCTAHLEYTICRCKKCTAENTATKEF